MSSLQSLKVQPFQRLTSSMWNAVIGALENLYFYGGPAVSSLLQNGSLYVPNSVNALQGNFLYKVTVAGEPVLTEADPIYISGFVGLAYDQWLQLIYSNRQLYNALVYLPYEIYEQIVKALGSIPSSIYYVLRSFSYSLQQTGQNIANAIISALSGSSGLYKLLYNFNYTLLYDIAVLQRGLYPITQVPYEIYKVLREFNLNLNNAVYSAADILLQAVYKAAGYIGGTIRQFYNAVLALTNTLNTLELYLSPSALQSLQVYVISTPAPITTNRNLLTSSILLQNAGSVPIYIGSYPYVNFPIFPGDKIELFISRPANVWARANKPTYLYALFSVISS